MAILLKLREEAGELVVTFDDQTVKTALDKIPAIDRLQADPYTNGQVLTAALGGNELLKRLADDPDNLILLDCDDTADAFAWEFATLLRDRQFLCVKAGMLRLVNKTSEVLKTSEVSSLNFIALAADPLVDESGNPRERYRLDLDNEMRSIRETLQNSGKNLTGRRIPPTREHLNRALRQGPAVLHLTCHGNVVDTPTGKLAVLALENKDGSIDPLTGADLLNMSPRGVLRMVLLSSCMTATGSQANLARALALNGVPFAVGMQESFPDPLSDDLAVALYDSLFSGLSIGEALRQARMSLARHPQSVGLPVGYVSANGWSEAFPIQQGTPSVSGLGKPGESALGGEIQPPRPLLGRNLELHQIAKHFADGGKVITVAGTGGMGKTALAAAFAERFAWMWARGVSGYSFANEVNAANFRYALIRVLLGDEGAQQGASLSESQQREDILKAAREWNGLWLFDNYESIIQGIQEKQPEAENIHRLIADLANGDSNMLLTSREQPAGLRNERLFPDGNHSLHGLRDQAGVELFFQHSVKANENPETHIQFAFDIQHAAEGHPLAIALLAGEYDVSAVPMQAFLGNWQDELASARRGGLAGHHATFTIAFERSYSHLSKDLQEKLALLSIFPFPFFAHGAVMSWDGSQLPDGEEEIDAKVNATQQNLSEFTRRSLLEVDARYGDDTPATYRFQPALRQEAARRLDSSLTASQQVGYAAYGAWVAKRGYLDIHSNIALNRVVRLSMDAMEKATDSLQGTERLWHIRRLAWLKNAWGETRLAFDLVNSAISEILPNVETDPESAKVDSSLRYELAGIYVTRGDLDRALSLYQESLASLEQLGDKQGKAASLSAIANIYVTRGELENALELYKKSVKIQKQLDDKGELARTLHQMAYIYVTRGNLNLALELYEESLQLKEQIGDKRGKANSLTMMAKIFLIRGDLDRALQIFQESLKLFEQLGDTQGKTSLLALMAQVFLKRGDLDQALTLYQESLEFCEQLGDKQNKAHTLGNMAQVFQMRGDLDRALQILQESLQILNQLGDKKDKAAILGNMANIYMTRKDWEQAEKLLLEALELVKAIGEPPAFEIIKLGQLAQVRGDKDTALSRYREGLVIFESMGMPEAQEVREMITSLEGGAVSSDDSLAQVLALARAASQRGDVQSAIQYQEQAASLARGAGERREALVALSVILYNLAGFYQKAERHGEAVKAMEEVVAIDKQTGHQDLESDRKALETLRRIASLRPEEREQLRQQTEKEQELPSGEDGFEAQLQAQLAQLPPEKRAQAETQIRKAYEEFQRMTPEEQARTLQVANDQSNRAQIDKAANQARDAGLAYIRKQAPKKDILGYLDDMAQKSADGEEPGSPWLEVAALCNALIALIKEEAVPPVPAAYASHFSAVQSEMKEE